MKSALRLLVVLVTVVVIPALQAASLRVGDQAPPVAITKWIRGGPVDLAATKEKKVVVIEFWATWCPPCRTSIPHLTKLQEKYKDRAVIVGVTKPDGRNSLEMVEKFTADWKDKMQYTVAFDGDGKTYESYMTASGQGGIPTAFIVDKSGTLAWMGHPMGMDRPLDQIMAGTFDIELAAIQASLQARMQSKLREQDLEAAGRVLDALSALDPSDPEPLMMKFQLQLYRKEVDGAGAVAKRIIEVARDNDGALNQIAWLLLTREGLKGKWNELALSAAERAVELTKGESWMVLDTLALAQFENGKKLDAAATQKKAIALARKEDGAENQIAELEERLKQFEE